MHEAVAGLARRPEVLSLDAHTLDEIIASVRDVGAAAGEAETGRDTAARLRARIDAVRRAVAGRAKPRVLCLEWLDPPFAPGHWIPEMIEIAGGDSLIGTVGGHSVEVPWSAVEGLDPDRLLLVPCGYALEPARDDADRARGRLHALAPRAIAGGDAAIGHSAFFSRSGPRVVAGIEALAAWLHPDAFPAAPDAGILEAWR